MPYSALINLETVAIAGIGVWLALVVLRRRIELHRPGLRLARPVLVGYGLRLAAAAGVSATGIGLQLRGGDEVGFLADAHKMAATPWFSSTWKPLFSQAGSNNLHVITFAAQIKALSFGPGAMRITQIGIAMVGALLVVAAVYDLAGRHAAQVTAWLVAIEPTSVFFSGTLLKEPLLELAAGLVIFGGARVWRRLDVTGLMLMAAGCALAVFDRGYVGFFLMGAAVLLLLHASARHVRGRARAIPIMLAVLLGVALISPAVANLTTQEQLQAQLQNSQNANTLVTPAPSVQADVGKANGNNLALEPVDFSSRTAIVEHLPQRIFDLLFRPYPWQLGDWSQRLGAFGGLIVIALLFLAVRYAWRSRRDIMRLTGPLLYPTVMMLIAYSLSVGNAGTGFRYRAHLLIPTLGIVVILWLASEARAAAAAPVSRRSQRSRQPNVLASGRPTSVASAGASDA